MGGDGLTTYGGLAPVPLLFALRQRWGANLSGDRLPGGGNHTELLASPATREIGFGGWNHTELLASLATREIGYGDCQG